MLLSSACQETGVFLAPRELEVATAIPVPNPFPNVPTLWTHFSVNRFVVRLSQLLLANSFCIAGQVFCTFIINLLAYVYIFTLCRQIAIYDALNLTRSLGQRDPFMVSVVLLCPSN